MAIEIAGELVLTSEETQVFIHNLMHPNTASLNRRDAFLSELQGINISFEAGELVADCPDISLPAFDFEFYDEHQLANGKTFSYVKNSPQDAIDEFFKISQGFISNPQNSSHTHNTASFVGCTMPNAA